jgi:hypothetical protein
MSSFIGGELVTLSMNSFVPTEDDRLHKNGSLQVYLIHNPKQENYSINLNPA